MKLKIKKLAIGQRIEDKTRRYQGHVYGINPQTNMVMMRVENDTMWFKKWFHVKDLQNPYGFFKKIIDPI